MNADRLLAHYEQIADAPDAIARLRRFILDLAVRGKLVPHELSDEPALELMKRIEKEKSRLAKAGQFREPSSFVRVDRNALPFEPASHWGWARLIDVARPSYGFAFASGGFNSAKRGMPLIRIRDISSTDTEAYFEGNYDPAFLVTSGDYLVGMDGDFNLRRWQGIDGLLNQRVMRINGWRCGVEPEFVKLPLQFVLDHLHGQTSLTTVKHLSAKQVNGIEIPLPPLAEQRRIVAKVDELMGLCDQLKAALAGREAARNRLAAASLARLNAPDSKSLQADARFALDALPAITTRPDQIKALRQTILNLAVRGKLVSQDAKDEPASELLKRIAMERVDLVKRKEIRREDPLSPIKPDEMPFVVATNWVWSRIGDAFLFTQYGTSQKSNPSEEGVPVLTMGNIQDGSVVWRNEKRVPETCDDLPALFVCHLDLLYNRTNSAELVGKTGIYLGEDRIRTFASYLIRLRPSLVSSNPRYLNMAMNTPEFRQTQIVPHIKKQTGQANVNGTVLKSMLIPLPPLAEQHRIVAKVDALTALCDRLEASLTTTAATRRRLLDALLAEALTPAHAGGEVAATALRVDTTTARSSATLSKERSAVVLTLAYERHRAAKRDKSFGHVKAQKILHVVEAEADYDLGRAPIRDAAGPNDFQHMLAVEDWALQRKRFKFERIGSGYTFKPLSEFDQVLPAEADLDAKTRSRIEKIIDFFIPMDMETAEVVATVYAAWNNLLIEGKRPEDDAIVRAAREDWHPRKLSIPRDRFVAALQHLRKTEFVPSGRGKHVPGIQQQDLFSGHESRT